MKKECACEIRSGEVETVSTLGSNEPAGSGTSLIASSPLPHTNQINLMTKHTKGQRQVISEIPKVITATQDACLLEKDTPPTPEEKHTKEEQLEMQKQYKPKTP